MAKKLLSLVLVMCCVFCLEGMTAFAYDQSSSFCDVCGCGLNLNGENVGHWSDTHQVYTGYTVGGQRVMVDCTRWYEVTRLTKWCPNGCRSSYSWDTTSVHHSRNH